MSRAWTGGKVSHVRRKALVFPVHKKGSKFLCKNYREISIPEKVYAKILDQKMGEITEGKILGEQGTF